MAFEREYGPLGPARADHLTALLAAAIRNTFVSKERDLVAPKDCMPDWTARPEGEEVGPDGDDS